MTDKELQLHVLQALAWEPSVDAADIGVSVDRGVVTLRGDVKSYAERSAAERVAVAVAGVRAVANDINVALPHEQQTTDTAIARAVVSALKWNTLVPRDRVTVAVKQGGVTLVGQVDWEYQRQAAADAVRVVRGVRTVTNRLTLKPHPSIRNIKTKIEAALKRSAAVDADAIRVAIEEDTVILSGKVHSLFERNAARQAAWAAPGVKAVEDRLIVVP